MPETRWSSRSFARWVAVLRRAPTLDHRSTGSSLRSTQGRSCGSRRATARAPEDSLRSGYERGSREKAPPEDWWHPDGEYVNSTDDPDHATYRGLAAIRKLFASWYEAYPDIRVVPLEVRVLGERVFAWTRYSGRAATSGLAFDMELANVLTLEDGRIRRLEEYMDRAEALEAFGRTE